MSPQAEPNGGSSDEPLGRPDSVELLLDIARNQALSDEEERQRHLDTKAGTLAGFVAVALSLEAGLGASVLLGEENNCAAEALFTFFFVIALVGLAGAGLLALLGVLVPQGYPVLDDETVDSLATESLMQTDPDVIRERQLATLVGITLESRETDNKKARALKHASRALAVAIAAIAAQGVTLPFA